MVEESYSRYSPNQRGNQQRNSNYRYNNNQNRQRFQNNRSGGDGERDHWRRYDNNNNRNGYQQRNSGNYVNRTNSNRYDNNGNAVTLQAVIDDPSSLEAVHEARKRFLESFDEENSVSVVNDKLVYSIAGIIHFGELMKDSSECPFHYTIYNKKIVKVNSEVVEVEEKLDENCWDMPTTEDFSLDTNSNILEAGRSAFLEKKLLQSRECVERERAEVEQGLQKLEESASGQSLLDMLSLPEGEASLSPPADEDELTPRSTAEGLIEGIIEPDAETPLPIQSEVVSEPAVESMDGSLLEQELMNQAQKGLQSSNPPEPFLRSLEQVDHGHATQDFSLSSSGYAQRVNPNMMGSLRDVRNPYFDSPLESLPSEQREYGYGNRMMMPADYQRYHEMDPRLMRDSHAPMNRGNGMRQVYYVPNRYFNQMRHDSHPDLFQMFDEKDRAQQMQVQLYQQQQEREMMLRQQQMDRMRSQQMSEHGIRMTRGMREIPLGYGGPQQSVPGQFAGYPSQRSLYDQRGLNPYEQRGPSTFDQLGSGPFEQRGTNSLDQRGVNGFDQRQSNTFNQRNMYRPPYYSCLL